MNNKRVAITTGDFKVEEKATYAQVSDVEKLSKRQDDNEQTMRAVIIILLVMVATMIFSLQIAIWQSKQSQPQVILIQGQ